MNAFVHKCNQRPLVTIWDRIHDCIHGCEGPPQGGAKNEAAILFSFRVLPNTLKPKHLNNDLHQPCANTMSVVSQTVGMALETQT